MDEAGDLLEDSWFFGNLLHTKTRTTVSRSYSDLASPSSLPPHPYPPLSSAQESVVKNDERKSSSYSLRKQPPVAPPTLTRTPSLPTSIETQSFVMKNSKPSPNLMSSVVGSDQEDAIVKNERKSSNLSSRKQPSIGVAPTSLTPTPSLPTSTKTQSFPMKNPNQNHNLTRASSIVRSDQENAIQPKSSSFSSRKQLPVSPPNLTRTPSFPSSTKTQSFRTKNTNPSPNLTRTSSMSTPVCGSNQEDEDQENEFTLGRLIRQASINLSHTSNPPRQTYKEMSTENLQKKPGQDREKISDLGKLERNRSKITKNSGKNKNGRVAPAIPGGLVDKTSTEDMKAHIKFWARAVASNVRQECS